MSKKDYVLIAEALADALKADSRRFDYDRFLEVVGVGYER